MNLIVILQKFKRLFWRYVVQYTRRKSYYYKLYRSYWYSYFFNSKEKHNELNYFSSVPNPAAGIGHQMANWVSGYLLAKKLKLRFAHIPFSTLIWESFLGFGDDETTVKFLIDELGYKRVKLPIFNVNNPNELAEIKKIIIAYSDKKVVFVAEQDQPDESQYSVMPDIKQKFYSAKSRFSDKLIFSKDNFNIAVHVRRGDIVIGHQNRNPNLLMRFQDNSYFVKVLDTVLNRIKPSKPIAIYVISQGKLDDFRDFDKFNNLNFCIDMGATDSFLHMVYADLLITSKSSFSYKPALLCNGIKICPKKFWIPYPESNDFILVEDDGSFNVNSLNIIPNE